MKPILFRGSAVALVTPMKQDFSIHYEQLEQLLDFQIKTAPTPLSPSAPPANRPP